MKTRKTPIKKAQTVLLTIFLVLTSFLNLRSQAPKLLTQLGHQYSVSAIAITDDGGMLASADNEGVVNFWDVLNSTVIGSARGYAPIRFSADGKYLIVNKFHPKKNSRALLFYSTKTLLLENKLGGTKLSNLALDDEYRIIPRRRKIKFKPFSKEKEKFKIVENGGRIINYHISKALGQIAVGWESGDLILYDYRTGEKIGSIESQTYYAKNVAFKCKRTKRSFDYLEFSSTGQFLFCGNSDRLDVIDIKKRKVIHTLSTSTNKLILSGAVTDPKLQWNSRLKIFSSFRKLKEGDVIEFSPFSKEQFLMVNYLPSQNGDLRSFEKNFVKYLYAYQQNPTSENLSRISRSTNNLEKLLGQSHQFQPYYESPASKYTPLIVNQVFKKECPCLTWENEKMPLEKFGYSKFNKVKKAKTPKKNLSKEYYLERDSSFSPIQTRELFASKKENSPPQKTSPLLPEIFRTESFTPTSTGPLFADQKKDVSLNIGYSPEDNLFPFYYFYSCVSPSGYVIRDSLIDIAHNRNDFRLIRYFQEDDQTSQSKNSFLIKQKTLLRLKKIEKRVDTLKVELFALKSQKREKEARNWKRTKVACFDLDPTEKYSAMVLGLDSLVVTDILTGNPIITKRIASSTINSLHFSPDGKYLYFGEKQGGIYAFSIPDWKPIRKFTQSSFPVNQIRTNNNLSGFMTGNFSRKDGGGNYWDLQTGEKLGYINSNLFKMSRSGFDSTGKFLLLEAKYKEGNKFKTQIINFQTRNRIEFPVEFGIYRETVIIDSLERIFAVGGTHDLGFVESRTIHKKKKINRISPAKEMFTSVVNSPREKCLFLSGRDGWLYQLFPDSQSTQKIKKLSDYWVLDMKIDTSRNYLYSAGIDGAITVTDLSNMETLNKSGFLNIPIKEIELSGDGSRIAAADLDDNLTIIDAFNLKPLGNLPWVDKRVEGFTWSSDNQYLVTHGVLTGLSQSGEGVLSDHLYRVDSLKEDRRFYPADTIGLPVVMSLHPQNQEMIIGGNGKPIRGYNLKSGEQLFESNYHSNYVAHLAYHPNGKFFITASDEIDKTHNNMLRGTTHGSKVRVWDSKTGFRLKSLGLDFSGEYSGRMPIGDYANFRLVRKMSFSDEGENVILSHWNGNISVINIKTGEGGEALKNRSNYYFGYQFYRSKLYEFFRNKYKIKKPKTGAGREFLVSASKGIERFNNASQLGSGVEAEEGTILESIKAITDLVITLSEDRENHPGIYQEKGSENSQQKTLRITDLSAPVKENDSIHQDFRFLDISENLPYSENWEKFKNNFRIKNPDLKKTISRNHKGNLNCIVKIGENMVLTSGGDAKTTFWNTETNQASVEIVSTANNEGHLIFDSHNHYMATPGAMDKIAFQFQDKTYPIEVFDLHLNRPDKIISTFPNSDSLIIRKYEAAFKRRIRQLGKRSVDSELSFDIPTVQILTDKVELASREKEIPIHIIAEDTTGNELQVVSGWVDDVPIWGLEGLNLKGRGLVKLDTTLKIPLHNGTNKIQISATNTNLNHSLKESVLVECIAPDRKPNLYVVSLGVSEYKSPIGNLEYPAGDAAYLAEFLKNGDYSGKDFYGQINSLVMTNEDVSPQSLNEVNNFLAETKEDDVVLFFLSGHGENSPIDYEYYFLTSLFNGDYQEGTFSFHELDSILASCRSRNKLLLLNTCMAGEVDELSSPISPGEDFISMKQLFLDLRRSSGATVLASSSGYGYLREVAGAEQETGPLVHLLTTFLKENRDPVLVRDFCEKMIYLFKRRNSILESDPEVRFSNLSRNFRFF